MRSLTSDPLFYRLRQEAEEWHLTQSGVVVRYSTVQQGGRDVDVTEVIYSGPLGIKREKGINADTATLEFPSSAPTLHPADVVSVDTYKNRSYPLFVVKEYTPATENRVLAKAVCSMKNQPPKVGA